MCIFFFPYCDLFPCTIFSRWLQGLRTAPFNVDFVLFVFIFFGQAWAKWAIFSYLRIRKECLFARRLSYCVTVIATKPFDRFPKTFCTQVSERKISLNFANGQPFQNGGHLKNIERAICLLGSIISFANLFHQTKAGKKHHDFDIFNQKG